MTNHKANLEVTEAVKYLPVLNQFEQWDVLSKACLSLALKAPDDDATIEEQEELYQQQNERILSFLTLLHESAVTQNGRLLLCLYQCD